MQPTIRTGVVIATKGRPHAVSRMLALIARQTVPPAAMVVSATSREDVERDSAADVEFIFGPAGLCAQRNRGLDRLRSRCDLVVFFDDDFVPADSWLEQCARLFAAHGEVVGASGVLLRDGAQGEEVSWEEAEHLIGTSTVPAADAGLVERRNLYGCNMAFRLSAVGESSFDERLVLYGWMEDMDFSRNMGRKGRLLQAGSMVGVHLGVKSGRISGRRYGFSQVVNPWYLHRKGMLSASEAYSTILRPMLMNAAKSVRPEKHIDRLGRLTGNLLGLGHLLGGHCRPERAAEL